MKSVSLKISFRNSSNVNFAASAASSSVTYFSYLYYNFRIPETQDLSSFIFSPFLFVPEMFSKSFPKVFDETPKGAICVMKTKEKGPDHFALTGGS